MRRIEKKTSICLMCHIVAKFSKYIIWTFHIWKFGYRTKKSFATLIRQENCLCGDCSSRNHCWILWEWQTPLIKTFRRILLGLMDRIAIWSNSIEWITIWSQIVIWIPVWGQDLIFDLFLDLCLRMRSASNLKKYIQIANTEYLYALSIKFTG